MFLLNDDACSFRVPYIHVNACMCMYSKENKDKYFNQHGNLQLYTSRLPGPIHCCIVLGSYGNAATPSQPHTPLTPGLLKSGEIKEEKEDSLLNALKHEQNGQLGSPLGELK